MIKKFCLCTFSSIMYGCENDMLSEELIIKIK